MWASYDSPVESEPTIDNVSGKGTQDLWQVPTDTHTRPTYVSGSVWLRAILYFRTSLIWESRMEVSEVPTRVPSAGLCEPHTY